MEIEEYGEIIRKYALQNAVFHNGKAELRSVLGKILAEHPELRTEARKIADMIINEGFDLSWSASSRVDTFDKMTGERMHKAGAHTIYFGIESGTQKILDYIGKRITLHQSRDAVHMAKKIGFQALGSFIIGFPQETKEDIKKTINFAKHVGVDYAQFTVATPFPGTKLWYEALAKNLLLTKAWRKYTAVNVCLLYTSPSPRD